MKLTKKNIPELAKHLEKAIEDAGYGDVILADFLQYHICEFVVETLVREAEDFRSIGMGLK